MIGMNVYDEEFFDEYGYMVQGLDAIFPPGIAYKDQGSMHYLYDFVQKLLPNLSWPFQHRCSAMD
jgi:hypothetical protein